MKRRFIAVKASREVAFTYFRAIVIQTQVKGITAYAATPHLDGQLTTD